jgi:hypothetical protein
MFKSPWQSASAISSITVPLAQNGVQEFKVGTVSQAALSAAASNAGKYSLHCAHHLHPSVSRRPHGHADGEQR